MRGNPVLPRLFNVQSPARSIPASAGEPAVSLPLNIDTWVYPRECGGTDVVQWQAQNVAGLSPRVRGNQNTSVRLTPSSGSIPASAGEPFGDDSRLYIRPVYPRECGGTSDIYFVIDNDLGLSPRVRGTIDTPSGITYPDGLSPRVRGNRSDTAP